MRYLVAASMVVLGGGAHALRGDVIDGERLHKPEELVELGAISPLGVEEVVGVVQVTPDDPTLKRIEEMETEVKGLQEELESLRALKAALTEEEVAVVQSRLDEARAELAKREPVLAMNKAALQQKAKELELPFNSHTTVEELREAIFAKL